MRKKDWLDDLPGQMRFQNIHLYRMVTKKEHHKPVIALPFADNRGALFLARAKDGRDYFKCVGAYPFRVRPVEDMATCHQLHPDVECRIVTDAQIKQGHYLNSAIDCDELEKDIAQKRIWYPALGAEGAKWRAYLDMFKGVLDSKRFGVPVQKITSKGKITVTSQSLNANDEQGKSVSDKIDKARNAEVNFALLPPLGDLQDLDGKTRRVRLGKIRGFNQGKEVVHVELDKEYPSLLRTQIKAGGFFPALLSGDAGVVSAELGESQPAEQTQAGGNAPATIEFSDNLPADIPRVGFYYDEEKSTLAFSCAARKDAALTGTGGGEGKTDDAAESQQIYLDAKSAGTNLNHWIINPASIEVHCAMLFADFFGEMYQMKVMERGLDEIAKRKIWEVLSRERPANLPQRRHISWGGDCKLNDQQKEAVEKALGAPELCLIWGPPGTGKTEVIMEIAKQEALRGGKTLIASQANLAVDNALARLHNIADVWSLRIIREGYELEEEDKDTVPIMGTKGAFFLRRLQARLRESAAIGNASDDALRVEFAKRLEQIAQSPKNRPSREIPQMAKLYRQRINVVGATLMGTVKSVKVGEHRQNEIRSITGIKKFDTVIVDEVSKATPPELFLPALRGGRLVLVGDHKQLPPMLKLFSGDDLSEKEWAERVGVPLEDLDIESTLFERLWERHSKLPVPQSQRPAAKLTMQYRMHKQIQGLVEQFYTDGEGTLECGLKPEQMAKMAVAESGIFSNHAVWVDTANDAVEQRDGTSFVNNNEAGIVRKLLAALPGGKNLSVGVITFYGAQLDKLRRECEDEFSEKFPGKLIFGTVDRFQGRECDVVICSLVRKNKRGTIGFAQKANRINVAFSRARRLLCIVGNSGQFCFGAGSDDARSAYKEIYVRCKKANEKDVSAAIVPAGVDVLAAKWGVNVKK